MIWLRSVYDMIWYDYDTTMVRHVNDGYIYVVIWYEICYGTRYVINWHVYDMIYCDTMLWYNMYMMKIVMSGSMKCYDMTYLCTLNDMIWYDWHAKRRTSMKYNPTVCMKDMINDMINDHSSFTIIQTYTLRGRKTIIVFIIMLQWSSRKPIIIFIIMLWRSGKRSLYLT